jgi:hypothetical protein
MVLASCGGHDVCCRSLTMRLRYDRGTILLVDPPLGLTLEGPPGVKWPERQRSSRSRLPARRALRRSRTSSRRFLDELPGPGRLASPFAAVQPRPYQEEAVAAWTAARRRAIVVLPTGAGKTRVAIAAIAYASGLTSVCRQWTGARSSTR